MCAYLNMSASKYFLKCWDAMCISSSVTGLSIIFTELFSILQFSKILTKIRRENIVSLIRKSVGEQIWVYIYQANKDRGESPRRLRSQVALSY